VNAVNFAMLLMLAALWGASFLFTRVSAPVVGPLALIEYRMGLAALVLAVIALLMRKPLQAKTHWRHYLILGFFNAALPFLLFAYAAQTLPASMSSILNATSPIWSALIGALWLRHTLPARTLLGLVLGISGVTLVVGFDAAMLQVGAGIAAAAALLGAFCYGISTVYTKLAKPVNSFANAHGSMWAATLLVVPALPYAPTWVAPNATVTLMIATLGVVCTGLALILYFRLVENVGATSALTVTFLVPVFGILWGAVFLHEVIGWNTVVGSCIVIVGTALVTGFNPRVLLPQRSVSRT